MFFKAVDRYWETVLGRYSLGLVFHLGDIEAGDSNCNARDALVGSTKEVDVIFIVPVVPKKKKGFWHKLN